MTAQSSMVCWGANRFGDSWSGDFLQVAAGEGNMCGLHTDGRLECRGVDYLTKLGQASFFGSGDRYLCGRSDGSQFCWSDAADGTVPTPRLASGSVSSQRACGVTADGAAICWEAAELPQGRHNIPPSGAFQSVTTGIRSGRFACGVRVDGGVACWGGWTGGAPPAEAFRSASAGVHHVCGILRNGAVKCWQDDFYDSELSAPLEGKFTSIHAGDEHVCGLREDGTLACWEIRQSELILAPEGRFKNLGLDSRDKACGVRIDGELICWVSGTSGELSILGGPPAEFVSVSVEGNLACGIDGEGLATCWVFWSGCKRSADGSGCTPDENVRIVELEEGKFREIFVADTFNVCGLTIGGERVCGLRLEELD